MMDALAFRPLVVHVITRDRSDERCQLDGFEVRTVGLGVAAHLLHLPVASFDCVRMANALADIKGCPVCRYHRRLAA